MEESPEIALPLRKCRNISDDVIKEGTPFHLICVRVCHMHSAI